MHIAPSFDTAEAPQQLIEIAYAYLDAALELTERMASGAWPGSYYRGQAALWLAFHASEVFLKGCITSAGHQVDNTHSLTKLKLQFEAVFPNVTYEPLYTNQAILPDPELMEAALLADREMHQQFRYPVSAAGTVWGEWVRGFDPRSFAHALAQARSEFKRVHEHVTAQAGG